MVRLPKELKDLAEVVYSDGSTDIESTTPAISRPLEEKYLKAVNEQNTVTRVSQHIL